MSHLPKERFNFIHLLCYWQGSIKVTEFASQFSISRQQASADLRSYRQEFPLRLQRTAAGYCLNEAEAERMPPPPLDDYLSWLLSGQYVPQSTATHSVALTLQLPQRLVPRQVLQALVRAIRERRRMELGYVSLTHPDWEGRIFHPHTLVKTALRWHVRGYCEKSAGYRDLVLSRCCGDVEVLDASAHTLVDDAAWQTQITLILAPDPRLTAEQQQVLAHDYQMEGGQLLLDTRAALAEYLLKDLQVNTRYLDGSPEAQQLVLVNRQDVKQWLFNG